MYVLHWNWISYTKEALETYFNCGSNHLLQSLRFFLYVCAVHSKNNYQLPFHSAQILARCYRLFPLHFPLRLYTYSHIFRWIPISLNADSLSIFFPHKTLFIIRVFQHLKIHECDHRLRRISLHSSIALCLSLLYYICICFTYKF